MINPFKRIKDNSRYTYNDRTIIVYENNKNGIAYYYLDEWWPKQPLKLNLYYMSRWSFIMNVSKYKYA